MELLRRLRKQQRLTQAQLARRAGLAQATVSNLEKGAGSPTMYTLECLAEALGVEPECFFSD